MMLIKPCYLFLPLCLLLFTACKNQVEPLTQHQFANTIFNYKLENSQTMLVPADITPTVILFSSPWNEAQPDLLALLKILQKQYKNDDFFYIDAEENLELVAFLGLKTLPTFAILVPNQPIVLVNNFASLKNLEDELIKFLPQREVSYG